MIWGVPYSDTPPFAAYQSHDSDADSTCLFLYITTYSLGRLNLQDGHDFRVDLLTRGKSSIQLVPQDFHRFPCKIHHSAGKTLGFPNVSHPIPGDSAGYQGTQRLASRHPSVDHFDSGRRRWAPVKSMAPREIHGNIHPVYLGQAVNHPVLWHYNNEKNFIG